MELTATARDKFGKQVKALRKEGLVPAELYGRGVENRHLSVSAKEFGKVFKEAGTNTIVTLAMGGEKRPILIHDVACDLLTGEPAHVDFYQVRLDEKIRAKVPLEFVGEAPAVKVKGGVLNKSMTEIEVEALPQDLPHSLQVDLSALDEIDKSVYVRDLAVPKSVTLLVGGDTAIATATPPAPEEEAAPAAEAVGDVSAVKVESEEKKAERQAEKASDSEAK